MSSQLLKEALAEAWGGPLDEFEAAWDSLDVDSQLPNTGGCADGTDWTTETVKFADGVTREVILGAESVVLVPSGGSPKRLRVRYALYPAAGVMPSHDPWSFKENPHYDQDLQERDYWNNHSERDKVVRGSAAIEPRFLLNSVPTAVDGPPVILRAGPAMGGNGRTMMILRSMAQSDVYTHALRSTVEAHGEVMGLVGAPVADKILVRVLLDDVDADSISNELNASFTQHIDQFAEAASIGKRLPREVFVILGEAVIEDSLGAAIRANAALLISRLRDAGVITPQNETDWLGVDRTTGRRRVDQFAPEGSETLRQAVTGAFVQDKRIIAKSSPRLRDLCERIAPIAMALDTWDAPLSGTYNVTPAFRTAVKEAWRITELGDADLRAYYGNVSMAFGDQDDETVIATPPEVFTQPLVAAAVMWLREYARNSRVQGARRWTDYWRAIPEDVRDPGANVLFPSEPPVPETLRERVLGLASTDTIERIGIRHWLGGQR